MIKMEEPPTDAPILAETLPEPPPKQAEATKKIRRRSSLAIDLIKSFHMTQIEEAMSPIEQKPIARPRRSVQMRQIAPPVFTNVQPRKKPVRYSFDVGQRASVKSCLKPTNGPILVGKPRKTPAQRSRTQQTARKVLQKYRKSGSLTKTPLTKRTTKLTFNKYCSIRVITPRPEYDENNLAMPSSDDESDSKKDPNRERLSTVQLRLTPTSQAMLESTENRDVVQFNAEMVFGDREQFQEQENVTEAVVVESEEVIAKVIEVRKKTSRRKSLILGAASPLKSPAKIEKPRFEEEILDEIPQPTRRSRRSVRLNRIESSSTEDDEIIVDRKNPDRMEEKGAQKKRELISDESTTSTEPQAKRNRRKSAAPVELEVPAKPNRRKSGIVAKEKTKETELKIHSFFSPKPAKKPVPEVKSKRCRRSSAYFGVAKLSEEDSEDVETAGPSTSAPEVAEESNDSIEIISEVVTTASSSSSSSRIVGEPEEKEVVEEPAPLIRKIEKLKNEEVGTPPSKTSGSPAPAKLFSLFSPKPKIAPPPPTNPVEKINQPSDDSSKNDVSAISVVSKSSQSCGIKRKENWGDLHPESYQFIRNIPIQPTLFEKYQNQESQFSFKDRRFDETILQISENLDLNFREAESKNLPAVISRIPEQIPIEKLSIPEGSCPTTIYPPSMEMLVEGSEEEGTIRGWLKKWKRRVRKVREQELLKSQNKRKSMGTSKRGRRKKKDSDEEDSDEEYNVNDDDDVEDGLENPLVLIGPTGVGKTALIRALAKQENMRIISMGPETDRTSGEIKKTFEGAIRSHRVDQQPERRVSMFFSKVGETTLKTKEAKNELAQSVIVFEHVDVFFETHDRYGVNGLLEVVNSAMVPVIFTCEKDWPNGTLQVELKRSALEVHLGRNKRKVQKYVQKVIYSCRDVFIDDSTIRQLSESVNHDLNGLLRQAHLYSLSPDRPLPLTTRRYVPSGFEQHWEKPRGVSSKTDERLEELVEMYAEVLPDGILSVPHPKIDCILDKGDLKLAKRREKFEKSVQKAHDALNGRYLRRNLVEDVLPLLVTIDRAERERRARNRRHLHLFKTPSEEIPIDGEALMEAVAEWGKK